MSKRIAIFFNPHPGLLGCPRRLPEPIRLCVASMDGVTIPIADVMAEIIESTQGMGMTVGDYPESGCIMVRTKEGEYPQDLWRVIQYREVKQ